MWIDFNNDSTFDNATEQIYVNTSIASHPTDFVTVTGSFVVPNTAVVNKVLRLRIIEELSGFGIQSIPGGCYNSLYGQAEDFPLYFTSTLPVVLESFAGRKIGDEAVLTWTTSFEQNVKEFQVEKSVDGVNFQKIGTVPAASIANGRQYSFVDRNLRHENNYYRLKSLDMDGQFEFSKIVTVRNPSAVKIPFNILSNPVQTNLDIQFNNDADGPVQLTLSDMTGKTVMNWNGRDMSNRKLTLNVSNRRLGAGVYVLHARIKGKEYTEKVVLKF